MHPVNLKTQIFTGHQSPVTCHQSHTVQPLNPQRSLRITTHESQITAFNNMRIIIIGDNNCARATRHLVRLAGFAVTEFLPGDAVTQGPQAGYAITIDLAPAPHTPDAHLRPDHSAHHPHAAGSEEAPRLHRDASSPSFAEASAGKPFFPETSAGRPFHPERGMTSSIHFDSVDSALEDAVLRHVAQLAAAPVILDRPGGVVHSDRELRIVAPNTGDAKADEAAAVAIEFGVLRGLLDLTAPAAHRKIRGAGTEKKTFGENAAGEPAEALEASWSVHAKKWWPFWILLFAGALGFWKTNFAAASGRTLEDTIKGHRLKPVLQGAAPLLRAAVVDFVPEFAEAEPQGQFATGQGIKITDGTNSLVVDPCKAHAKSYASISQTANTQLVAGTASKKIYICSIHVLAAAATNVAVAEGTGTVCGTGSTGVSGFGGATAATGWNFAANGGIALGNGDSSLGAEGTSGDNLCIFNSGSGQVSGGISYVVQ